MAKAWKKAKVKSLRASQPSLTPKTRIRSTIWPGTRRRTSSVPTPARPRCARRPTSRIGWRLGRKRKKASDRSRTLDRKNPLPGRGEGSLPVSTEHLRAAREFCCRGVCHATGCSVDWFRQQIAISQPLDRSGDSRAIVRHGQRIEAAVFSIGHFDTPQQNLRHENHLVLLAARAAKSIVKRFSERQSAR